MLCPHHSDATPAITNERGMSPSLIVTSGRACAHCARSCPYLRRKVFFSESRPRRTQRCCFSNLCEVNHHRNYRKTKFFCCPKATRSTPPYPPSGAVVADAGRTHRGALVSARAPAHRKQVGCAHGSHTSRRVARARGQTWRNKRISVCMLLLSARCRCTIFRARRSHRRAHDARE